MSLLDVTGLRLEAVLAALYNRARPQGLGLLAYDPSPMTPEGALALLDASPDGYFDYVHGRVMKIRLRGDTLDPRLYDRDNGDGAAAAIITALRAAEGAS